MRFKLLNRISSLLLIISFSTAFGQRQMENLDRGIVAVPAGKDSALISWRLLKNDDAAIAFNVYRQDLKGTILKLNEHPVKNATCFMDGAVTESETVTYFVKEVVDGIELPIDQGHSRTQLWKNSWWSIPLQTPDGYTPNDGSVADLDGDGEYEIVVHMVGQGHDNSHNGYTSEPVFHAYKLDGTLLWSINLGKNIREGSHYTQFLVYDFDCDGKAEIVMKTADGTVDGIGKVVGDSNADYRNEKGHILSGPEYLTVFDGLTGKALATVPFEPRRHPRIDNPTPEDLKALWGDGRGNRSERYLAGVAYLNGKQPSIIMSRGYYTRVAISAWDWNGKQLMNRWSFGQ